MGVMNDTHGNPTALTLRVAEVAAELQISTSQVYALIQSGRLRPVRIGKRGTRVARSELDRFIREGGDA